VLAASIIRTIALRMQAVRNSETSVIFNQTTQCNIPEDGHLLFDLINIRYDLWYEELGGSEYRWTIRNLYDTTHKHPYS
jgi:hypothetical protein